MNHNKIATRLRDLRGDKTLQEVADAVGVERQAIYIYEIGHRIPRDDVKKRLASYYGVTVEEIFFAD